MTGVAVLLLGAGVLTMYAAYRDISPVFLVRYSMAGGRIEPRTPSYEGETVPGTPGPEVSGPPRPVAP